MFDTLANPQTEQESPIAPTLQILLTRMWKEAKKASAGPAHVRSHIVSETERGRASSSTR